MKSPSLRINLRFLFYFLVTFISSCDMTTSETILDKKVELLEETSPGSESFQDEFDTLRNSIPENGMNLAISANIIHYISFNESNPFSLVYPQFCCSYSGQVATNPLDSKDKVGRFELRNGDEVSTSTKTSARAEILFPKQTYKERWYAVSIFFPLSGYSKDRVTEIIMQWHQGSNSPPNSIRVADDKIVFRSIKQNITSNSDSNYINYPIANVERGKWNEFIFHYIHSPYSDGLIEIWYNGKKLHTIKGTNMRSESSLPRLKVGVYKWKWDNGGTSDTSKRILFFDNLVIANENSTIDDVKVSDAPISNETPSDDTEISSTINSFYLIDASRDVVLGSIKDGGTMTTTTEKLNITANMSSGFSGKVLLELTGPRNRTQTEGVAPYSLFGDDGNGNYYFDTGLISGNYTLKATPIVGNVKGISKTIKFQLNN